MGRNKEPNSIKELFQGMIETEVEIMEGTVTQAKPFKIAINNDAKLELDSSNCTVPEHLTDHEVEVSITSGYGWKTQKRSGGGGYALFESHDHDITAEKQKIMLHQGLKVGDVVMVLSVEKGQQYFVLGRI